jgi:SAM-dependent methyltransferase
VEQPVADNVGDGSSTISTNHEHEDRESIFDEDYHSDTSNYTASLLSDVKNYTYENGRRYHSYREGHYVLPNDDQEQDRQDLLHHVRNLVLNGALFCTPLGEHVQRVLDIGTGTGIWAIDFADSFPSAEVIGTDLSPIQPSWIPPNLRFLVDDAESQWLFSATRPFDFIHARDLGGAIADWPRLLRQAREHLRPGGWVELQEFEVTLKSDDESMRLAPTLCEFLGRLHQASEAFHRPMNIAEGHRQRLIEAGFEEVRDEMYKVRPAEIGIIFPPALTDRSPGP